MKDQHDKSMTKVTNGKEVGIQIPIDTLRDKYPDVEICTQKTCQLTQQEHEVFYAYEQIRKNHERNGTIEQYTKYSNGLEKKYFQWFNGKTWVTLGNDGK